MWLLTLINKIIYFNQNPVFLVEETDVKQINMQRTYDFDTLCENNIVNYTQQNHKIFNIYNNYTYSYLGNE